MADDRNRPGRMPNNSGEDFDWEKYDEMTSQSSASPRRTRRGANAASAPRSDAENAAPARRGSRNRKSKKKKKRLTEKQIRFRRRLRLTIFSVIFIGIIIASGMLVGMYAAVSREIKDMNIRLLAQNTSSAIYYTDDNGNEQELEQLSSDTRRIWIDSTQIPQVMKDAIVSIEDERFYNHHGFDFKRTLGATTKWVLSKVGIGSADYGGSTITQQVIKNITNEKENTPARKVKEIMRAIALENELSKDEILTMYLNIAFFANNCNGVEAAALTYFDKNAADLTLPEAASIAGITQYPSEYDPFTHPENNIEKRNIVLKKMNELGYITDSEYAESSASDLIVSNANRSGGDQMTSYFVDQVINDIVRDLMEQKAYSEDFATRMVYNGGLKIYATIDTDIQDIMEDVFTDTSNFPGTGAGAQSAMVVVDPYTGQVKGIMGGLGEKTNVRGWNRATQMARQPGSSIKPLSVYSPAIDTGKISEVTTVVDEEITIGDDKWKPKNSYDGFLGDMTVKEAISRSANIPAVKILDMVGVQTSMNYLRDKYHMSTIVDKDRNYSSLALGGLTKGVTVEDMAAAYATFVNSGKYIKPHTYTKVLDAQGNEILTNSSNSIQAISAASAFIMTDLLNGVVTLPYGTGQSAQLSSMPTYGKTGTTDDDCDKWFVGFTPYYSCACWFGFDNPSSLSAAGISGNPAISAWRRVMERIHENLNAKEIPRPSGVKEATVCEISGKLATDSCPSVTGYFVEGTVPRSYCDAEHASRNEQTPSPSPSPSPTPSAEPSPPAEPTPPASGNGTVSSGGTTSGGVSSDDDDEDYSDYDETDVAPSGDAGSGDDTDASGDTSGGDDGSTEDISDVEE